MNKKLQNLDNDHLHGNFRNKIDLLLITLKEEYDLTFIPFFTARSPQEQAKLWRQSRSTREIKAQIQQFKIQNQTFLAHVLENTSPQYGKHVTNAAPGYSWHQHGLAVDCFHLDTKTGKASWDANTAAYRSYAALAESSGFNLRSGKRYHDWVHIQQPKQSVSSRYSSHELDQLMYAKWGQLSPDYVPPEQNIPTLKYVAKFSVDSNQFKLEFDFREDDIPAIWLNAGSTKSEVVKQLHSLIGQIEND